MNWKTFLKPDWRKITATFILSILTLLISFSFSGHLDELPLLIKIFVLPYFFRNIYWENGLAFLWWLILPVVIWYLLSCLTIFVWDKLKKRKI
ncbi:MAG: hypothetical protein ACE5J0_02965 [Candidatus Paceibacterales bacterium]